MPRLSFLAIVLLTIGIFIGPVGAAPVSAPYSIDFRQYPPGPTSFPDLIPNIYANISTYGAMTFTTASAHTSTALQITNLTGQDFEISTDYGISGDGGVNLVAASTTSDLRDGYFLTCLMRTLYLRSQSAHCGDGGHLSLRGHVHDGLIDLVGTFGSPDKIYSSLSENNMPLYVTGEYYGNSTNIFSPRSPPTFSYYTLSVNPVVPEPSLAFFLPLCGLLLRRRHH